MQSVRTTALMVVIACAIAITCQSYLTSQNGGAIAGQSDEPRIELRRVPVDGTEHDGTLLEEYTVLIDGGQEYRHGRYRKWLDEPYVLLEDVWYYKGRTHGPGKLMPEGYYIKEKRRSGTSLPRRREFNCVDGKLHGKERYYYADGTVASETDYVMGEPRLAQSWYSNGMIQFWMDYEVGLQRDWYETGVLQSESEYDGGAPHGRSRYWYPSGQLKHDIHYRHGLKHGSYAEWYENGQKKVEGAYVRHETKVGEWKYWNDEGELIRTEDHGDPPDDDESDD